MHNIVESVLIIAKAKAGLPQKQQIDDFRHVLRVKTGIDGPGLLAKIIGFIEWSIRVIMQLKHEAVDMVNCHSLSVLPLCVALKFRYHCLLVYEPHELETETHESKGIRKKLAKITEKALIRFVDKTFVVSASIADQYAQMYRIVTPTVILNCPVYISPTQNDLFRKHFCLSSDAVIFLYQGNLAKERGVHTILESFKRISDSKIVIIFMGSGPLEAEIKKNVDENRNIYLHSAVPPEVVLRYTASADVGIHFIPNTCLNHYYCMPNKLFEYSMAGLPVIISNMHEMASFVNKHNTGIVLQNESAETLIKAIYAISKKDLSALKKNALEVAKIFCWEEQEKIMIVEYRKLFRSKK
jgi:glycosyltransferase involved in cell wall biosynthesis